MKPEKKIDGSSTVMLICMASFCVCALVDTSKPRLAIAKMNIAAEKNSATKLP